MRLYPIGLDFIGGSRYSLVAEAVNIGVAVAMHRRRLEGRGNIGTAMSRLLITLGVVLIVTGPLWPFLQKAVVGRLPGDIVIERENFRFYLPFTTSLLISLALSPLVSWLNR